MASSASLIHTNLPLWPISDDEFNANELTVYTTSEQRQRINSRQFSRKELQDFLNLLSSVGGMVKIASDHEHYDRYPLLALRARIQLHDAISNDQVASICMLYQAIHQLIKNRCVVVTYVKNEGGRSVSRSYIHPINSPSDGYIPQITTYHIDESNPNRQKEGDRYLQAHFCVLSGLECVKKQLRELPLSEQYFHTVELPIGPLQTWSTGYQRISEITSYFLPVDSAIPNNDRSHLFQNRLFVVPSFSMYRVFFDEFKRAHAILMSPLIGSLSDEVITRFTLEDRCVIQVGVPGAEVPQEADGLFCGAAVFTLHDLYHNWRKAHANSNFRFALTRMHNILERTASSSTEIQGIQWKLINGEIYENSTSKFGLVFRIASIGWTEPSRQAVINDMVIHAFDWMALYNLSYSDLYPEEQLLYDAAVARQRGQCLPETAYALEKSYILATTLLTEHLTQLIMRFNGNGCRWDGSANFSFSNLFHHNEGIISKYGALREVEATVIRGIVNASTDLQRRTGLRVRAQMINGKLPHLALEGFGHVFNPSYAPWDDYYKRAALRHMVTYAYGWRVLHNITRSDLEPPEQSIYDALLPEVTPQISSASAFEITRSFVSSTTLIGPQGLQATLSYLSFLSFQMN